MEMEMEMETCVVPPGFRFRPTEEELVGYYLKRKINSEKIDLDIIVDLDLYKMEPWDIQENCKQGYEEEREWYFFSHKDKKYPTGTRTNRATAAGFWKATGRDKAVVSKNRLIGMRKTLVFYRGRAPSGSKTDWIMHEYRLQTSQHELPQEEGWVVCRAFKKPSPNQAQGFDQPWHLVGSPSFSDSIITTQIANQPRFDDRQELVIPEDQLIELPNLDNPTIDDDIWRRNSYTEWKGVDELLVAEPFETELLYDPNLVPMSQNCDMQSQHQHKMFRNYPNL